MFINRVHTEETVFMNPAVIGFMYFMDVGYFWEGSYNMSLKKSSFFGRLPYPAGSIVLNFLCVLCAFSVSTIYIRVPCFFVSINLSKLNCPSVLFLKMFV